MSLEKTGNIETEANELLRENNNDVPTWVRTSKSGTDKTFGLRDKDDKFYIGNKEAKV